MKGMMKKLGRVLMLALAVVLALNSGLLSVRAYAERGPEEYVFTDYGKMYDLESFLNGYNVLSFGNTYLGLHCIGALLVQGNYDGAGSNSGFADGENMPPSYIKGHLNAPNSVYNSRNHQVDPLYVGSSNTVTTSEGWGVRYYSVNGLGTGNNSTTPVYVSDNFFNFAQAYAVVKQAQTSMQRGSTVVEPDADGVVTVPLGSNVTIRSMEGVRVVNLTGDPAAKASTTINILEKGDVAIERQFVNGKYPAVVEQAEEGVSIVWNFPNAQSVLIPTQNWLGHIVAPDADVAQASGNYNGCIICNNLYSSAEGHLYNYTADETSWSTVYSVHKVWDDGNNADGIRPDSIRVQLLANGKPHGKPVTLRAADGWYHLWDKLPETDPKGNEIVYSVQEVDVPKGYEATYDPDTQTLVNTHEYETVDISGTKTWLNEWGWSRPWNITVRLFANGREVASQQVNTSYWGGTNRYTFKDLPKYENGKEIVYTIHEDPVPGYIGEVDGYDLINTFGVEPISISGVKVWDDGNDADGLRPTEVVIQLLANGEVIEEHYAAANTGWTFTFANLPEKDENMQPITYTVREKETPVGYTGEVDGYTITNRHEPETTTVSGAKTWKDDNNNDGKRPESITVILLANMREVARKTVTAADGWKWTFEDMPKNDGGQPIRYTVTELAVEGYISQADGMNLINTHENETTEVRGEKTWEDNENAAGGRPASITIRVWDGNREVASKRVTEADNWAWAFTDLPKYRSGKEIAYTITEDAVFGYETSVEGFDVINTYTPEKTSVSGAKTWNDADNQDGKRPVSITITLLADGKQVASKMVTAADNWAWSFTDLPKYADGQEIAYTITEEAVPGYTSEVTGYDVVNTYAPEKTSVSGAKTWNDANNQDGKRPASITINLLADGKQVASKTVTAADNWAWSFTDLPKYTDGQEIVYTITEEAVPGYTAEISGYDVINTYAPEKTSVSGAKTWNDANNQDGKRPASITITLLADGKQVASKTVTAADNWAWSFTDLPKYADGQEIVYTITEEAVPGYTAEISGYDVINTYAPEKTSVSGAKTWNDVNNQDGKRPASITITLLADGKQVASKTVTAADNWAWSFTDLPKFANGEEIVYTISEAPVAGYTAEINGFNVTNTYQPEFVTVSGSKTWRDDGNRDGLRPASITIRLLADGKEIDRKVVTAAEGWAWQFVNLPKYADGREIAYTITEDTVPGYTTLIADYDVINTHLTEDTSISGRKLWFDDDNAYGVRPASVTVHLLANGRRVATRTVTAADGWMWTFDNLPVNENGNPIVYTLEEDPVPDYATFILGYNILNSYDRTSFAVTKIWEGPEGGDIRLTLYADGKRISPQPEYRREGSMYIWDDLPVFNAEGEEIEYSATEQYMDGYMTIYENFGPYAGETDRVYDGGTIINRGVVNVFVRKVWAGYDETMPKPEIQLVVYCNGDETDIPMPEPDKHGWYKYYNLPAEVNGEPARYTVVETKMNGFLAVYTGVNGEPTDEGVHGGTITNVAVPATGDTEPLALWTALLLTSAAALLLLRRRRAA